jgi:hypothetical protein
MPAHADEGSGQPFAVEPLPQARSGPFALNADACPAKATDRPTDRRGPPAATLAPPPGIGRLTTVRAGTPKIKIDSAG